MLQHTDKYMETGGWFRVAWLRVDLRWEFGRVWGSYRGYELSHELNESVGSHQEQTERSMFKEGSPMLRNAHFPLQLRFWTFAPLQIYMEPNKRSLVEEGRETFGRPCSGNTFTLFGSGR